MIRSIFRRSFVGALALFVALSAVAEEVMEEIIVTAQKREQSVMDVPMAITTPVSYTHLTLPTKA